MNRSAIREQAFKLIYSLEIQTQESKEEQIELYIANSELTDKNAEKYIKEVVLGIEKNEKDIIEKIEKNLKSDWKIERISKIDRAILKLAIYEIKYTETPFKVVINEAVELAKKYRGRHIEELYKWNFSKHCKTIIVPKGTGLFGTI